ncbi:MAG: hypothetical protein LBG43_08780 [Treponema sp.]|jgi:hypothetical protein|nr:hypothetical protein [Treponema sp.]
MEEAFANKETALGARTGWRGACANIRIKRPIPKIRKKQTPYVFFDSDFPERAPLCTINHDPIRGGCLADSLISRLFERCASAAEAENSVENRRRFLTLFFCDTPKNTLFRL